MTSICKRLSTVLSRPLSDIGCSWSAIIRERPTSRQRRLMALVRQLSTLSHLVILTSLIQAWSVPWGHGRPSESRTGLCPLCRARTSRYSRSLGRLVALILGRRYPVVSTPRTAFESVVRGRGLTRLPPPSRWARRSEERRVGKECRSRW